uniref:Uncharacterized protein n=1 Tax=Ditylum brightwellii TaxID=49249 RepID=A0A6V2I1M4_9STRA
MSLENLSPPPSSAVLGRQHQQQQQQPQPYHQHQHPPANPHPLRHAYTTMGYRSSGRLSISGGSGSNSSGAGPGNSVRFSKLSDMSVSFNLSASIGLTRSASLPGLRTSGDNTYDKDELCEDSLLLPSRFDEEDEEQVDELLRGVGGASSHIGSWKQASWMTASMNHSRNMSKSDLPGPEFGKCSGGTATTALSSGRGSDVGGGGFGANVPKKPHVIQTSPATGGAGGVNELHSSSSGKASSVFSFTQTRGSSKSSGSADSFNGTPNAAGGGGGGGSYARGSHGRQQQRYIVSGSNASFTGMSFTSEGGRSSTSSWLAPYRGMDSVGSDINPWSDEVRSIMSDISTDLLALDLAETPPPSSVPQPPPRSNE